MAEYRPLRLAFDEFGNPVRIAEFQAGDTFPPEFLSGLGVTSVNGQTGTVVLGAADVGAETTGSASAAVAGHVAAADPHPQYTDNAEATAIANAAVSAHAGSADPHSQYQLLSAKGLANGYASLDSGGKVPTIQLPSFVDDVVEVTNYASLPGTGESGKLYITVDNSKVYRWSGTVYIEIVGSPGSTDAVPEGSTNLYFTAARAAAAAPVQSVNSKVGHVSLTSSDLAFGLDAVADTLTDRSLTPDSQGAVGDGVVDDTSPAQSAINFAGTEVFLRHGQKYRITTLDNPTGKPFVGDGHIVKSATGGLEAQNTYADRYQRVTGQENLAAWYRLIYNQHVSPTRRMRIVFSGDSTTAGAGVATADYWISTLVLTGITEAGMQGPYNTECINNGNSGAHTGQWASTFVSDDIADAPDLLVLRWGINDPGYLKNGSPAPANAGQAYPNRRDINDFAASLRSGLATFRAARPFATTSILLMMPNSTYDIPNARDALWYEQLRNVYIQAARDFRCAFIDTYAIMQDSKLLAGIMMDDPYSDGRGIHPNEVMNSVIAGHIVDLIIPQGLRYRLATNKFFSLGGNALEVSAALDPASYDQGLYYTRTLPVNGWPLDGNAITFRTADQTVLQYNFGYSDADRGKLKFRLGRATTIGGQPAGWSQFYDLVTSSGTSNVTPDSGYSLPAPGGMRVSLTGTMACFDGYITKTSPSTIPANTRIAGIATGFAPIHEAAYCVATVWDGSAFEQVPARVDTLGNVTILKATTLSVQRVWINVSYDRRV